MPSAVQLFATAEDEDELLDYVLDGERRRVFPWVPMRIGHPQFIAREESLSHDTLCVLDETLGDIVLIRPPNDRFGMRTNRPSSTRSTRRGSNRGGKTARRLESHSGSLLAAAPPSPRLAVREHDRLAVRFRRGHLR